MENAGPFTQQAARWDRWASFYDADSDGRLNPARPSTSCSLTGDGPALDLGIGSGRIAGQPW